jgi:hypothetical protein
MDRTCPCSCSVHQCLLAISARIHAPSHHNMNGIVNSLDTGTFHSGKKCGRVTLEVVDHEFYRTGSCRFVGPCCLVSVLKWKDEILPKWLRGKLAANGMRNWVGTSNVCKCPVRDMPVCFCFTPINYTSEGSYYPAEKKLTKCQCHTRGPIQKLASCKCHARLIKTT